jgi:hypothetical protein
MTAPSDGARADARKARAANAPPIADMRRLPDLLHTLFPCGDTTDLDAPPCWTAAQTVLASDWLAGVIADAKAEALERVRQFAKAGATSSRALGHNDRHFLDLLILCDHIEQEPRQ